MCVTRLTKAGIVVFSGLSNVSSAVFQYRLNANSLGNALVGNFKVGLESPCRSHVSITDLAVVGYLFLFLLLWFVVASDYCTVSRTGPARR